MVLVPQKIVQNAQLLVEKGKEVVMTWKDQEKHVHQIQQYC